MNQNRSETLKIIPSPSLRQQISDTLREAIALGQLAPGERLVERVLCERMGVSRTSLREALRELEIEGLVTATSSRRLIISKLSPKGIKDIAAVRALLEGLICREFCNNAPDDYLAQLEPILKELEVTYNEGELPKMAVAKRRLYDLLMDGANNHEAERMLRSIHIRVSQLRTISLSSEERRQASLGEMRELISALKKRNADRAEQVSREHVHDAAAAALKHYKGSEAINA